MLSQVINWIISTVGQWGYTGIIIMMFLESSCFPFPSEVVMVPAGYLASPGYINSSSYVAGREMNFWVAVLCGIVGSWLGALFNYYLALLLGRPLLLKFGKYFFISEENFKRGEEFFKRHGEISTFTARLIPVVRQYISLPAGLVKMNMARFLFYTGLGAGIWAIVLAWIGYVAGQQQELIKKYLHTATLDAIAGCALLIFIYVMVITYKRKKEQKKAH